MAKTPLSTRSFSQLLLSLLCLALHTAAQVEVTTTIVIPAPTQPASTSYTSDTEFKDAMLNVTNRYRKEHHADALTWNETLAATAQDWADKCKWKHSVRSYYYLFKQAHIYLHDAKYNPYVTPGKVKQLTTPSSTAPPAKTSQWASKTQAPR
jgi:hypothetical protein